VTTPGITRLDVLRHDRDTTTATLARMTESLATTERRRPLELRARLDLAEDIRRTSAYLAALEREIAAIESGAPPTRVPGEMVSSDHVRAAIDAAVPTGPSSRAGDASRSGTDACARS
jgi:hypothetical protein